MHRAARATVPVAAAAARQGLADFAALARTAAPIAAVGIVSLAMSLTDALMLASLDPRALSAGAMVGDLFSLGVQVSAGALGAFAAPVAAATARGADGEAGSLIAAGLRLALCLGIVGAALVASAPAILGGLGIALPLPEAAVVHARFMAATFVLMMVVALARAILPAIGRGGVTVRVIVAAVPLNAVADAALMHGWLGLPRMGLAGAGAASLAVTAFMAAILLLFLLRSPAARRFGILAALPRLRIPLPLLCAGAFTGAAAFSETGIFLVSTVVAGMAAADAVPAHVAVFRALAITYVIGSGFAAAITIHVARAEGTGSAAALRAVERGAGYGLVLLGAAFLVFVLAVPQAIAAAMGIGGAAVGRLAPLAAAAALGLLAAGTAFGFLRARGDVTVPALVSLAGCWGIGFALMVTLSAPGNLGPAGVWAGLAAGTASTAAGSWAYLALRQWARPRRDGIARALPAAG